MALLLGIGYPAAMTGVAQLVFPVGANGGLAHDRAGTVIGSTVRDQAFTAARHVRSRPSALGLSARGNDDGPAAGASNLGFLGDPHVPVLALNQAPDAAAAP